MCDVNMFLRGDLTETVICIMNVYFIFLFEIIYYLKLYLYLVSQDIYIFYKSSAQAFSA